MRTLHKPALLIGAFLTLYCAAASAQLTNQGMLDQVVTEFATRATAWQTVVMNAAMFLFWTLGTISMVVTFGFMALRKADIGEFFAEFIKFILFFGFFLWLLRNGPNFANSIIQSLARIGEQASGFSSITPSSIVDVGFMIWKQAIRNLSAWSPIDSFIGAVLSAGILLLLAVIAVNMLLLLVSGWLLSYAGIFFLGFGGSRWTSDMAINYYKTVLGLAAQLMAMVLLVAIGKEFINHYYTQISENMASQELAVMLVISVILLFLVNKVPPMISGLVSGGGIGAAGGIGNFGAGAAVGAAVTAASMATGGAALAGKAVMGAAAGAAGGASALQAAFQKASASMETGGDMSSMGSVVSSGGNGGGEAGTAGSSPFAQAAGFGDSGSSSSGGGFAKAAKLATGTASELAKGVGSQVKQGFQERVSETTGGKLAASIRESMEPKEASQSGQFEGNSLGADSGPDSNEVRS